MSSFMGRQGQTKLQGDRHTCRRVKYSSSDEMREALVPFGELLKRHKEGEWFVLLW